MKTKLTILLILAGLNGYSLVQKKVMYSNAMVHIYINEYDTLNGGSSYEILAHDYRYSEIINIKQIYEGDDVIGFIEKVLTFAKDVAPETTLEIDGTYVTAYPKYLSLSKGVGYRVFKKKRLENIKKKILENAKV